MIDKANRPQGRNSLSQAPTYSATRQLNILGRIGGQCGCAELPAPTWAHRGDKLCPAHMARLPGRRRHEARRTIHACLFRGHFGDVPRHTVVERATLCRSFGSFMKCRSHPIYAVHILERATFCSGRQLPPMELPGMPPSACSSAPPSLAAMAVIASGRG